MRDCSIELTNRPGDLARVAEAFARRGVNIKALTAMTIDGKSLVRILPDDIQNARSALEAASIRFTESEVQVTLIENRPGELATVADRLGDAGINLEAVYLTGITDELIEVAFICDNPKKAKKVLEEV